MSSGRFTLDYLIEVVNEIHRRQYVVINNFNNRTETQRILTGLIKQNIAKKCRLPSEELTKFGWLGIGRPPVVYSLAVPYEAIRLGDVYSLVPGLSGIRLRLCQLGRNVTISRLTKCRTLDLNDVRSHYGPEILLCGLSHLTTRSWRQHDALDSTRYRWGDRQWSSDMTSIGILENKYGAGYKLTKPLTGVKISLLYPYLCYRSKRKQSYNRLFYLFRQHPVSVLLPPYDEDK